MQKVAFVFTCLACATTGRGIQDTEEESQNLPSAEGLATLLLALDSTPAFFGKMPSKPSMQKRSKPMEHRPSYNSLPEHVPATQRSQAYFHQLHDKIHQFHNEAFGVRRNDVPKESTENRGKGFDFFDWFQQRNEKLKVPDVSDKALDLQQEVLSHYEKNAPDFVVEHFKPKLRIVEESQTLSRRSMFKLLAAGAVGVAAGSKIGPTGQLAFTEWKLKQAEEDLTWKNGLAALLGLVATGEAVGLLQRQPRDAEPTKSQTAATSEIKPWNAREAGLTSKIEVSSKAAELEKQLYEALVQRRSLARKASLNKNSAADTTSEAKEQARRLEILKAQDTEMQEALSKASEELDAPDAMRAATKAAQEAQDATLKADAATVEQVKEEIKQRIADVWKKAQAEKAAALKEAEKAATVKLNAAQEQLSAAETSLADQQKMFKQLRHEAMDAKARALKALKEKQMFDQEMVKLKKKYAKIMMEEEQASLQELKEVEELAAVKLAAALEEVSAAFDNKEASLQNQIQTKNVALKKLENQKQQWDLEREKMKEEHARILEAEVLAAVEKSETELEKARAGKQAMMKEAEDAAAVKLSAALEQVTAARAMLDDKEASLHQEIKTKSVALRQLEKEKQQWILEREKMKEEREKVLQSEILVAAHKKKTELEKAEQAALKEAEEAAAEKLSVAMEEVTLAWSDLAEREETLHKEIATANEAKRVALREVETQRQAWIQEREQRAKEQKEMAEVLQSKFKRATAGKGFQVKVPKSAKKSKREKRPTHELTKMR